MLFVCLILTLCKLQAVNICEYVSHSRRHSLQRMKLHHSHMLQDLCRKQEALSLEQRSANTRGRLTTTSGANTSLVPLVPLMSSGGKGNLQLLAQWRTVCEMKILTAELLLLARNKITLWAFIYSRVCLILFKIVQFLLPLAAHIGLYTYLAQSFFQKSIKYYYLLALTFIHSFMWWGHYFYQPLALMALFGLAMIFDQLTLFGHEGR